MKTQTLAIATVLVLSLPVASAWWGSMGAYEPDTKRDVNGGWMWTTPDQDPSTSVNKVYFNGYWSQCANTVCEGLDANLATSSVRTSVHNAEYLEKAILGVWKDCNKDNYVGLGDQGLFVYRAELLLNTSVCPKESFMPTRDFQHGVYLASSPVPPHNDGTWVHELIPIQWLDTVFSAYTNAPGADHNVYNDNDNAARVWVDHGLEPSYQIDCYYTTFPTGTFRSTGGLLHTEDCLDSYRVTDTFDTAVAAADPTNAQHLSFADAPRDQAHSSSKLNQANPWGNEQSDGSYVQAWDCKKPQTPVVGPKPAPVQVRDDTGFNVSQPLVPPTVSTTGSLAGTMNATGSGFDRCYRNTHQDGYTHVGDTLGSAPYAREAGTFETAYRTSPDDNLAPIERNEPDAPYGALPGYGTWGPTGDFGAHWLESDCHNAGDCGEDGVWTGNHVFHQETVYTSGGGATPFARVMYSTYYGFVSPSAVSKFGLAMPKGTTTGTYGVEACGTATSGVHSNWDCDKTHWYKDANGGDHTPRSHYLGPDPNAPSGTICAEYSQLASPDGGCLPYGALPGDAYDLVDYDCYDQSVQNARALGVSYGTLTGSQCDWAPTT